MEPEEELFQATQRALDRWYRVWNVAESLSSFYAKYSVGDRILSQYGESVSLKVVKSRDEKRICYRSPADTKTKDVRGRPQTNFARDKSQVGKIQRG